MKMIVQRDDAHAHLTLRGELDLLVKDGFVQATETFLDEGFRQFVVDMRLVRFLGISGVTALLYLRNRALDVAGSLAVTNPRKTVAFTLQTLGVDDLILASDAPTAC